MASIKTKICRNARVEGDVKFGFGCMIHPYAKITAEEGSSITFGDYNIIEDSIKNLLVDANAEVRSTTRKAFILYKSR